MKFKMTVLAFSMLVSTVVSAQSVTVSYGYRQSANGTEQTSTGIAGSMKLAEGISGDVAIGNLQDRKTLSNGLREELGLTFSKGLFSIFSGNVRLAHGFKMNSGKETIQYYNIEPSVTAKFTGTPFSAKVGYRYRNTYDSSEADRSDTTRYSMSYELTKKDRLSVLYDEQRGVGAGKQTTLAYTRSF